MSVSKGLRRWRSGLRKCPRGPACVLIGLVGVSLAVAVFASSSHRVLMLEMDRVPPDALARWQSGEAEGERVGPAFPGCRWGLPPGQARVEGRRAGPESARIGVDVFPVYCSEREYRRARSGDHPFYYLQREFEASPHWHIADSTYLSVDGIPLSRIEAWMVRATLPAWQGPQLGSVTP